MEVKQSIELPTIDSPSNEAVKSENIVDPVVTENDQPSDSTQAVSVDEVVELANNILCDTEPLVESTLVLKSSTVAETTDNMEEIDEVGEITLEDGTEGADSGKVITNNSAPVHG